MSGEDQRESYTRIKQVYEESSRRKELKPNGSQRIKWKNILFDLLPNRYIQDYRELWCLESIIRPDIVQEALLKYSVLDANFVESLLQQSPYYFYVDSLGKYLLSDDNELFQSDFGALNRLTALEAVQRYGLSLLEESKEKGYVRV